MAPILTNIENTMAGLIDSMNPEGGYNLTWGDTNEHDSSRIEWNHVEAQAEVDFISEDNTDQDDGAHARAYANTAIFRITVRAPLLNEDNSYPVRDIRKRYYLALDDLKKLFGTYQNLQNNCHYIQYTDCKIQEESKGDVLCPVSMSTFWRCEYWQDRISPETFAC